MNSTTRRGRPLSPTARPQGAKYIIESRGLTQWEVAKATDILLPLLTDYLNGRRRPPAKATEKLSEFLGVPVSALFEASR